MFVDRGKLESGIKMAAIVRVKRRRHDDPADSLLLSSKRLKSNDGTSGTRDVEDETVQSVFVFAGTITETVGKYVLCAHAFCMCSSV